MNSVNMGMTLVFYLCTILENLFIIVDFGRPQSQGMGVR